MEITAKIQALFLNQVKCCGYRLAMSLVVINTIPDIGLSKAPVSANAKPQHNRHEKQDNTDRNRLMHVSYATNEACEIPVNKSCRSTRRLGLTL